MPTDLPHKPRGRAPRISADDDVAVAGLDAGETASVAGSLVTLHDALARGHERDGRRRIALWTAGLTL